MQATPWLLISSRTWRLLKLRPLGENFVAPSPGNEKWIFLCAASWAGEIFGVLARFLHRNVAPGGKIRGS